MPMKTTATILNRDRTVLQAQCSVPHLVQSPQVRALRPPCELSLLNAALRSSLVIHGLKDEFNLLARQQLELGSVHQRLLVFRIGAEHPHLEGPVARRPAIKTAGQAPRVEGHAIGRAGQLSRNAQCANANVNFSG